MDKMEGGDDAEEASSRTKKKPCVEKAPSPNVSDLLKGGGNIP